MPRSLAARARQPNWIAWNAGAGWPLSVPCYVFRSSLSLCIRAVRLSAPFGGELPPNVSSNKSSQEDLVSLTLFLTWSWLHFSCK